MNYEIRVVLIKTLYASNIGSTARAMTNMGAAQLILVNKNCEIDFATHQAAASGQRPLENRLEYKNLEEFYQNEPNGIRIAMTARDGRARKVYDFKSTLETLKNKLVNLTNDQSVIKEVEEFQTPNIIYLFFGTEDSGLSQEDIQNCHYCCSLPTYGENWSLNLSQAVLLTLFILRDTLGGTRTTLDGQNRPRDLKEKLKATSPGQSNLLPDQSIKLWLETLGFDLNTHNKVNAYTVLKRLMLQNIPTTKEVRILEAVIQQTIRKLTQHN